ncbi:glycosyltransferase [Desulfobulbus propionicus]
MTADGEAPLVVHTDWSRSWGGQEIRVLTELREMRRHGFRVALIVPRGAELARRAAAEEIPVHEVASIAKLRPSSWLEMIRLIRAIRPTVLNTHSSEDSWLAGAVGRMCRVPLIIRTRHVLSPISSRISYNFFPHLILTCSNAIAEQMANQGVKREKLAVASTGNDEERFRFSPDHRQEIRKIYGIDDDQVVVGNVGFLRHYKGHPFILKTMATLPDKYCCILVGGGDELPRLQALAKQLGIAGRVIFAGHQEQPERYYSAFDLFFFSSNEAEGISQALIQALLNGLPILGCDIPSTREALHQIEASRLVDYDDVAAAGKQLRELTQGPLRDPERMERQRRIIAEQYGLDHMMRILLDTYRRHGVVAENRATFTPRPR